MSRRLHLTEDHVRRTYREVPDAGPLASSVVFSEEDYDAHLSAFLKDEAGGAAPCFLLRLADLEAGVSTGGNRTRHCLGMAAGILPADREVSRHGGTAGADDAD